MKKSFFLFFAATFVFLTCAKAETEIPDFGSNWLKTPASVEKTPNGDFVTRFYLRVEHIGGHSFQVGNVNYFKVPKVPGQKKFEYEDVARALKEGMGFDYLASRDSGNAKVFEGDWREARRFVRLYVRENQDSVEYSVATMRSSYGIPTTMEAEVIQRELFGVMPSEIKGDWLKQITASMEGFSSLIFSDADAASGSASCSSSYSACLACGGSASQCCALNGSCGSGSGGGGTSVSTSLGTISIDPTQYASIMSQWGTTNSEITQTDGLLQQALTDAQKEMAPGRLFLQAGATAAGAALGADLAGIAVEFLQMGATKIATALHLLQAKSDTAKIAAFQDIKKKYEDTQKAELMFEAGIDKALDSLAKGQAMQSSGGMTFMGLQNSALREGIATEIEITSSKLRNAQKKLDQDELNSNLSCAQENDDGADIAKLRVMLANYQTVRDNIDPSAATTCQKVSEAYQQLLDAEGQLQHMRLALLADRHLILKDQNRQNAADQKVMAQVNRISPERVAKDPRTYSAEDKKRIQKEFNKQEKQAVSLCEKTLKKFDKDQKRLAKEDRSSIEIFTDRKDNAKKVCEEYVKTPAGQAPMSNAELAKRFDPSLTPALKAALTDSGVLAKVAELEEQKNVNDSAYQEAARQVAASTEVTRQVQGTANRSAQASLGQLDSTSRFFDQLEVEQSGGHPGLDQAMVDLLAKKDRIQAVCKGDWLDNELGARGTRYSSARGDF